MINLCISELCFNDLSVNVLKSVCLRVGVRHNCTTCNLSVNTQVILWQNKLSFLGFTFLSGPNFKCNLQINKQKYFSSVNGILSKVGDKDFSSLTLSMVDSFCVPVLLYGLEALDNKSTTINSIDFAYNGVFVKLFNIKKIYNILYCQRATNCLPASCKLDVRTLCFHKALMSGQL